ncbi:MAG: thermonuclease family protein, partial [Nitrosopumilaceae archaeon]
MNKIAIFSIIGVSVLGAAFFAASMIQPQTPSNNLGPSNEQNPKMPADFQCQGNQLCIIGTVERIVDGDTIQVNGKRIRLSLTNTPETDEPGYQQATDFTASLCSVGSSVIVDQDDKQPYDIYGRVVAKVYCSDKILNAELLYNGHANILTNYCSTSEFATEDWAKKYGCTQMVETKENKQTSSSQPPASLPPTQTNENNCDPSYPDVCIPPYPPDL